MRRRALYPFVAAAVVFAVAVAPAACDSTLNLGDADGGSAASTDGPVFVAASCASACDKVIACGLLTSDKRSPCVSSCMTQAPPALLECIARTACAALQSTCSAGLPDASFPDTSPPSFDSGQEGFEIMNCQQACDSLHFFNCLDASGQASCRDRCTTAPMSKRNSFTSCGEAAGGNCPNATDCFDVFVGD